MKKAICFLIIGMLFLSGCELQTVLRQSAPLSEDEGEVFLYLQPFPQEAERLKFSIEGLSALKDDGAEYPLSLTLPELSPGVLKRQRLLASGHLPPGAYSGLSMKVSRASLKGEEGESALLLPDKPVKLDFPFSISAKKAVVLSLSFIYDASIQGGFGFSPFFSIVVPDRPLIGLTGYVTNSDSHSITVFDKKSGLAAQVIETGMNPRGIVIDKRTKKAYVAVSDEDAVEVIDITAGDIINRIHLSRGDRPGELALASDGRVLLTVNTGSNSVSFVDPLTHVELSRLTVGNEPNSLVLDRTGRRAFVFNTFSNTVSVIDIHSRSVASVIATEPGPLRGEFNRRGDRLYVFFRTSPYLVVYDSSTFAVVNRIFVGPGTASLKVDTNTDFLYLGRKHDGTVEIYDPFSLMPGDSVRAGGGVEHMAIDSEENTLVMAVPQKKSVVIVNLVSKAVIAELDAGDNPTRVTIMGER